MCNHLLALLYSVYNHLPCWHLGSGMTVVNIRYMVILRRKELNITAFSSNSHEFCIGVSSKVL